jgi:anti-sigma factor RsiW
VTKGLGQSELEDLSAWLDGELSGERAERIARLVREDPAWGEVCEQMRATDAALDRLRPARPRPELAQRIDRATGGYWLRARFYRIAGSLAAAAAVLLVAYVALSGLLAPDTTSPPPDRVALPDRPGRTPPVEAKIDQALVGVAPEDRFIVRNLSMFQNYGEVERYEAGREILDGPTLAALAELEEMR